MMQIFQWRSLLRIFYNSTPDEASEDRFDAGYRDVVREETRNFNCENDTLVETGVKWKSLEDVFTEMEISQSFYEISSIFVENVKLD